MAIAEDQLTKTEEILSRWQEQGIRYVRFELPDMHGTSRSKIVPIENAGHYAKSGLNMYGGTVVLDSRSDVVPGTLYNEEIAYADQVLHPDPSTATIVPWVEATGRFICDTTWSDGRPLGAAPRYVFRRVLEQAHKLGYQPMIGVEYEFYLLDPETRRPLFGGLHIFNTVRNMYTPVVERIVGEMREMGIDITTANVEYAGSQWEITFGPGKGMVGPDQAFTFKNGVKELAQQEGLLATFMSKPFGDASGSGAHTHISLLDYDSGANALSDAGAPYMLSTVGQQFVAGQLQHARSIYALLAPTVNCIKRRRKHTFSPTNVSWGVEDRTAFVRVKGNSAQSRHVEDRAPAALANPYLACAALLAAGLLGIQDRLELEPPAHPPAEEDASKPELPTSLLEALDLLERDQKIVDLLGPEFIRAYTAMRRYELQRLADHVTDWELEEYLEMY